MDMRSSLSTPVILSKGMNKSTVAWVFALTLGGMAGVVACSSDDASPSTTVAGSDGGTDAPLASDAATDSAQADAPADAPAESSTTTIGPGPYTIVYAGSVVGVDMRPIAAGKATFDGAKLSGYESSMDERPTVGTNTVADVTGTSLFAMGRWAGGTTGGKFYMSGTGGLIDLPANGGFQYVIGIPADPIPSTGATPYTTLAKTTATISDGSFAPGTVTGTLAANLAAATTKVGFSVTLDIPGDTTYTVTSTGGTANPAAAGTGTAPAVKGAFFDNTTTVTTTAASCSGGAGCTAGVYGVVIGPAAENIALIVHVYNGGGGSPKSVSGAIVFKK
jgi:hypothetical protein